MSNVAISDLLLWIVPFMSGGFGVYVGLAVGMARLEANYLALREKVTTAETSLSRMREVIVGETRCKEYREVCSERIEKTLARIETNAETHRAYVLERLKEIAVYMAKHNGGDSNNALRHGKPTNDV